MRINTLFALVTIALTAYGCGAGGGSSSSASATVSSDEEILKNLQSSNWLVQPVTNSYGKCGYAAKFTAAGRFGLTQVCEGVSYVNFEAIVGSYSVKNGKITLMSDPNNCLALAGTGLRDAIVGADQITYINFSPSAIVLSGGTQNLSFLPNTAKYIINPALYASRGCNEKKSDGTYAWKPYSNPATLGNNFDAQFDYLISQNSSPIPPGDEEDDSGIGGGVVATPVPASTFGSTLQMSNSSGRVTGVIDLYSVNIGGDLYVRTNSRGDRLNLYVSGSPSGGTGYTNVSAFATIQLTQATKDSFNSLCGAQPTAAEFYMNQLDGETGGIVETIKLWAKNPNGSWCYGTL